MVKTGPSLAKMAQMAQDGGRCAGLTAQAIQALSPGATNSNTEIPSAHDGDIGKISIANIHAYMASSVGLGPRINPGPSLARAGQVPAVNAAGDAYELITVGGGGGTVTVIAGPVDPTAALEGQLQWNPANSRVEVCENEGHLVAATEGTWDYIANRDDLAIVFSRAAIPTPVVGEYVYDEGADHFYIWVVVGVDGMGNQVLGWRQVNPSTALAASRRTTGIVAYWLGDQVSDAAALASLGARFGSHYVFAERDAFYLRNDTIRRLETFTAAGTYVDNFEWLPMQLPLPTPAEDGELLVARDGSWIAQFRPEQFPHVTELPPAVEGGPEFIYLDHTYALGGRRVDADIRFSRVGNFTGYSDPRLGTPAGTLSAPGPITRILMVADNTGLITRYNLVEFIDQESADRYDEIALGPDGNVPLYPLGEPFQHGHVWQRRFVSTEPIGSRLDTQYKVNLGREVDATFFYNDQTGVLYRNGFYELIEVVPGEWIYDAISSLRRVHTSGIGQPVTPPIRTGETYTDDIGRNYTGLVEVIEIDDSGDGTPEVFTNALYVRRPTGLEQILELGRGAWWWTGELGPGRFQPVHFGGKRKRDYPC